MNRGTLYSKTMHSQTQPFFISTKIHGWLDGPLSQLTHFIDQNYSQLTLSLQQWHVEFGLNLGECFGVNWVKEKRSSRLSWEARNTNMLRGALYQSMREFFTYFRKCQELSVAVFHWPYRLTICEDCYLIMWSLLFYFFFSNFLLGILCVFW